LWLVLDDGRRDWEEHGKSPAPEGPRREGAARAELVAAAKALQAERPRLSLRQIAGQLAEQGHVGISGEPYAAMSVRSMLLG